MKTSFVRGLGFLVLAALQIAAPRGACAAETPPGRQTRVSIAGDQFLINDQPT